ncbi:MAG TPA: molybdenum cofactor guanylyltransferase [Gemmatimonadales bacterium]|nr:molybdenum cofactor guanylyltransferase [Gemmatimonadales bacterium]
MRGAVLAGGAATRFDGRPKGLFEVGGRRVLDRVVDVVTAALGAPPLLVANASDAPAWRPDLRCVPDLRPGLGSLGGVYTAIASGRGPVLVVAWDMPFLERALLELLARGSGAWDAYLPESGAQGHGSGAVEPLCAVYSPACRAPIERAFARGDLRMISFHDSVRVGTLSLDRVRAVGDPGTLFCNVNDPADLERAERLWRQRG